MNVMPFKTKGLIAAPFTPMHMDGSVNFDRIRDYANWLVQESVVGAFICGTTGEGPSLTITERLEVAEAWMKATEGRLRIIVHVGHNSLPESKRLANHAASIGADAIATMPPYFFKPGTIEMVGEWCSHLAGAAPDLPFYYYHIPSLTGVHFSMTDLLKLVTGRIPNFAGIKFTYEDLEDYQGCLACKDGRYDILFGRDEILLSALDVGAEGAVGSTYNFAASLFQDLIKAFHGNEREKAVQLQEQAVRLIDACINGPWHPIAAFKWLMSNVGIDCGPPRAPIPSLDDGHIRTLENLLQEFLAGNVLQHYNSPTSV
jgi:N-acetylneuraminate lyase